jgi:ribosome-binding protein aMBF1 (putative translation factor)
MRSKIAKRIYDETPAEVKIFVRKYGDIVVRVHQLLREKGWSQKDLAEKLDKTPSEISKWLSGDHNFTLRSLAKLEAELESEIMYVPKKDSFHVQRSGTVRATAPKAEPVPTSLTFKGVKSNVSKSTEPIAA